MAEVFLVAVNWCKHKYLTKWVKEKNGAQLVIAALEQMHAVRTQSHIPAMWSCHTGHITPVTELMDDACETFLRGVHGLVEDQDLVWDKSSIRKNAMASTAGLEVLLKYIQMDNPQLRCKAASALSNVVGTYKSADFNERVEKLKKMPGVQRVLAHCLSHQMKSPAPLSMQHTCTAVCHPSSWLQCSWHPQRSLEQLACVCQGTHVTTSLCRHSICDNSSNCFM